MSTTTDIEHKAINELERFIEDSECIAPFIDENDKEPCWDGHLYVYSDANKDKEHLTGRVPVQVKGTEVKNFKCRKYSFSIDMNDLKAYLNEPTFYIVCQIKKGTKERKLFYRALLPSLVKNIIRVHSKQKTVAVRMEPFPQELHEFEDVLKVFVGDSRRQVSFANKNDFTMEQVKLRGVKQLSFIAPNKKMDQFQLMKYLSTHSSYLYAKVDEDLDYEIPVEGPMVFSFQREVNEPISIGGKTYFEKFKTEIKDGNIIANVGDGLLKMEIPLDEEQAKKHSKLSIHDESSYLSEAIRNADFALNLHETGQITLGKTVFNISKVKEKDAVERIKKNLKNWKELKGVLDKLHVRKEFDLTKISREQEHLISVLIDAIGRGKKVDIPDATSTLLVWEISNVKLLLWCSVGIDGKCTLGDFFDGELNIAYKYGENMVYESSAFTYLQTENLWERCDNIPYEKQIASYEAFVGKNPRIYEMANYDMLDMVRTYDKISESNLDKAAMIYDSALSLSEWLQANDVEYNKTLHIVNRLQIIKRKRSFTEEEVISLEEIRESSDGNASLQLACSILLDDIDSVRKYENACTQEELTLLKQFPIWHFYAA